MPVIDVTKNLDDRSITITAEFAAPVERVWQIYADPRQLEKVWGPPEYPATFVDHNLAPGGRVTYYMTGPDAEKYAGYWLVDSVDKPSSFSFRDGFADENFTPIDSLPLSHSTYSFADNDGRTVATYVSTYETVEGLQKVLDMGMAEGATQSLNQIDQFLAG